MCVVMEIAQLRGAKKIAQLVKYKEKDLSLIPKTHVLKS